MIINNNEVQTVILKTNSDVFVDNTIKSLNVWALLTKISKINTYIILKKITITIVNQRFL